MTTDIRGLEDIQWMVDEFYTQAKQDALLGPVFLARIPPDHWQLHLEQLYRFWNAALFGVPGFTGNPFARHVTLPIQAAHFERWLQLFYATIDSRFTGPVADNAKTRAAIMANTFIKRLSMLKDDGRNTLV